MVLLNLYFLKFKKNFIKTLANHISVRGFLIANFENPTWKHHYHSLNTTSFYAKL